MYPASSYTNDLFCEQFTPAGIKCTQHLSLKNELYNYSAHMQMQ